MMTDLEELKRIEMELKNKFEADKPVQRITTIEFMTRQGESIEQIKYQVKSISDLLYGFEIAEEDSIGLGLQYDNGIVRDIEMNQRKLDYIVTVLAEILRHMTGE